MVLAEGLRRQLLLDEQRLLFDAWAALAASGAAPARRAIDPQRFVALLPRISLLDVCAGRRFRFRLAGTGLRALYGQDPTGAYLDEVTPANAAETWRRAVHLVAEEGRPRCGAAPPFGACEAAALLWLRLPLSDDGHKVTGILAYDHPISAGEAQTILSRSVAA